MESESDKFRDGDDPSPRFSLNPPFTRRRDSEVRVSPGGALTARMGGWRAMLVGGFFDDPSVHLERVHGSRSMLFDLGEVHRYPTRVLNRVSDIFISHAHLDHFAGFVPFLRTRVHGDQPPCRVWGPPEVAEQVASLVDGFTWDRVAPGEGPLFEVREFDGDALRKVRVGPNEHPKVLDVIQYGDAPLRREPRLTIRARILEHGTDSVAWAIEEPRNLTVRSDRLEGEYPAGPWLDELKGRFSAGDLDREIETPTGHVESVESLADRLLIERPGQRMVYATDFADTEANRRKVLELADGADLLFCESFYAADDADKADEYRHLTTTACGEIAAEAQVGRLIPFHFSSRYDREPERLYREILEVFERVEVPEEVAERM